MGYDGSIVFNTRLDNSHIEKDLKKLKKEIQKTEESISTNENAKLPLEKSLNAVNKEPEEAKHKAYRAKLMLDRLKEEQGTSNIDLPAVKKDYKNTLTELEKANKEMAAALESNVGAEAKVGEAWQKLKAAEAELKNLEQKQARLEKFRDDPQTKSDPAEYIDLYDSEEERVKKIKTLRSEVGELNKEFAQATDAAGKCIDKYEAASKKASELVAKRDEQKSIIDAAENLQNQESLVADLKKQVGSLNSKIGDYDTKIQQATADLTSNKERAAELEKQMNSSGYKMSQAFARVKESAEKFRKQILRVGASMIMFRVFSAVLQGISQYMGKVLKTNEEYTAQLAQLKAALATAFQPIYEFILPGLLAILKVLTSIVMVVANVLSALTGKGLGQSAKNAKELNEEADALENVGGAAKDAGKSLADFDEINTLSTGGSGSGSGGGVAGGEYNFEEFDTAQYKAKIDELTVYLSGALLAIGAILAFSGANIPLGIALMAAGALGIVAVVKENWGKMSDELKGALATVAFLLGGSLLAIGAVLAFSGSNLPLGIALMAVGAVGLVTTAALNWNSIVTALQGPVGKIVAIASGALLGIGLILALSGINFPLGIALMAVGGAGLVAVTAINWNAVRDKLAEAWEAIKTWYNQNVAPKLTLSFWKEKFSNIAEGLKQKIKDGINGAIALFNRFISWINSKMKFSWDAKYIGGVKIFDGGSIQLFSIPQIPYLAQGAVLPPNKPFMAMVGDQKNGTNIEAPLATIQEALANVLAAQGRGDINITFTGDLAQLGRVLKPVIDQENSRVGASLAKGVM